MEKELELVEIVDVDEPLADRDSHDICEGHLINSLELGGHCIQFVNYLGLKFDYASALPRGKDCGPYPLLLMIVRMQCRQWNNYDRLQETFLEKICYFLIVGY